MDSSWDRSTDGVNAEVAEYMDSLAAEMSYDIEARFVSSLHGFSLLHNKGVIVDDSVLIGSMNWCEEAFLENREVGAIIRSEKVASFFSSIFWEDYAHDPFPPTVEVPEHIAARANEAFLLEASVHDNDEVADCRWDLNCDGTVDWNGTRNLVTLPAGQYSVSLEVKDASNNTIIRYLTVTVVGNPEGESRNELIVLPAAIVGASMVGWKIWKRIKRR